MAFSLELDVTIETADGASRAVRIALPGNYAARCEFEAEFRQSSTAVGLALAEVAKGTEADMSRYLRDAWVGFYAWRQWARTDPAAPATFDGFMDVVEEVSLQVAKPPAGEGSADPTGPEVASEPAAPPG